MARKTVSVVFDGCIAIKWFFDEVDSAEARALGRIYPDTIAPSLILAEIGNAVWKRIHRKEVGETEAMRIGKAAPRFFGELVPIEQLQARAFEIMVKLPHPIYDCLYLALAERERVPLVTVDQRLIEAGKRLGTVDLIHLKDA